MNRLCQTGFVIQSLDSRLPGGTRTILAYPVTFESNDIRYLKGKRTGRLEKLRKHKTIEKNFALKG